MTFSFQAVILAPHTTFPMLIFFPSFTCYSPPAKFNIMLQSNKDKKPCQEASFGERETSSLPIIYD
jgi:hypothetical protein